LQDGFSPKIGTHYVRSGSDRRASYADLMANAFNKNLSLWSFRSSNRPSNSRPIQKNYINKIPMSHLILKTCLKLTVASGLLVGSTQGILAEQAPEGTAELIQRANLSFEHENENGFPGSWVVRETTRNSESMHLSAIESLQLLKEVETRIPEDSTTLKYNQDPASYAELRNRIANAIEELGAQK